MVARKANTPTLTREQIISAAIAIVDRESLDALSLRRLASELGVGTMTLYYHVPDKAALYDLIFEAVMSEMDVPDASPDASAEDRILSVAYALRNALLKHVNAAPIALSQPMNTPGQLRPIEKLLGILFELGLDATDATVAVEVVGQYIIGATVIYANRIAGTDDSAGPSGSGPDGISPEEFPNLMRMMSEAGYMGWDEPFDRGLRALIKGLILDKLRG